MNASSHRIDVSIVFATEDACLAYLEQMRWPNGVQCPACGCDRVSRITRKAASRNRRTRLFQCLERGCRRQFSATSGTVFADSHVPLTQWFRALAIVVAAGRSVSANHLKQQLGLGSYRTAWSMAHRIRRAMEPGSH